MPSRPITEVILKSHTLSSHNPDDDNILDLDALADKPPAGPRLPAKGNGVTIGEVIDLSKKDPSQLTAAQRKLVTDTNKQLADAMKPLMPQIKQAMDTRLKMDKMLEGIKLPTFNFPDLLDINHFVASPRMPELTAVDIIPPSNATEQRKQTFLLERMVTAFEAQNNEKDADLLRLIRPTYDAKKRVLIFSNTLIDISEDSDQETICKALFRSGKPVPKPVQIGDVLEKLGVPLDQLKGNKKVHYAKSALNTRIAKATQVDDLLVIDKKRLWFNKKYL